jgi:hypothetical protein
MTSKLSRLSQEKDTFKYSLEADLTAVVKDWFAIQLDLKATKICDRYQKGISDFLVCVNGIFVAIELKAEDKEPSSQQSIFLKGIVDSGGIGGVCETLGEVKSLINAAREKSRKN